MLVSRVPAGTVFWGSGGWRRVDVSNLQAVFGHKSGVSYLRQIIAKIRWIAAFYLVHRLFE